METNEYDNSTKLRENNISNIITNHQRSCGKVMFSQASVCHSVQGEGRSHVTINHDALDFTVQALALVPLPLPPDIGPHYTGTPNLTPAFRASDI